MRIIWIIWIAVIVYWQYFIINFLFQEAKFSPYHWRQLLELALVLFLMTIWISDCICLARIVNIRINSLSVSFWDGSSSLYFLRKLFKFIAYANSLDHLNCIYSELAVLYNTINISGTKFRSHQRTQLLELARVLFLLTTWISDCLFLAHIVKIRMNSLKG